MEQPTDQMDQMDPMEQPVDQPEAPVKKNLNRNLLLFAVAAVAVCITVLFLAWPRKAPEPQIDITITLSKISTPAIWPPRCFSIRASWRCPIRKSRKRSTITFAMVPLCTPALIFHR